MKTPPTPSPALESPTGMLREQPGGPENSRVPACAIPDHELLKPIGRGSYGEVWLARNVLGELRAVKIVWRREFGDDERPFQREFEGIQCFEPISRSHPSQLAILHVGKNDALGCFYYVMELADDSNAEPTLTRPANTLSHPMGEGRGEGNITQHSTQNPLSYCPRTLRSELKLHGALPAERVVEIGLALTEALAHLHSQKLVHRDIKPSNIIFVGGRPKLADIGLVTDAATGDDTRSIVGTEGYLAPEGPGTPQADLFALGKVLYEAATGLDRHRFPQLPPDLRARPDAGALIELNEILIKACATDRRERYQSAEQMRADFELLRQGKSVKRQHHFRRTITLSWKIATLILLLSLLVAGVEWVRNERARRAAEKDRVQTPWEKTGTTNRAAWEAVQRSAQVARAYTKESLSNAVALAERAIVLDPNYADAWAQLADASFLTASYSTSPTQPALERAVFAADKALHLKPKYFGTTAGAYLNLARSKLSLDYDFPAAEPNFRKAYELANDKDWSIGANYASILLSYSRIEDAERILTKLVELFPTTWNLRVGLAEVYRVHGENDRALQALEEAEQLQPNRWHIYQLRFEVLWTKGEHKQAMQNYLVSLRLKNQPETEVATLQSVLDRDGPLACLRVGIAQLETGLAQGEAQSFYWLAILNAYAGNNSRALDQLERAVDQHQLNLLRAKVHPAFKSLQQEPRFHEVLKRLKLE